MILAHLSELHVGYRAFERAENGVNLREADVRAALGRAFTALTGVGPAILAISGDVLHRPDLPGASLDPLEEALRCFRRSLPGTPVVVAGGLRDGGSPRPGALHRLESIPGVTVATGGPRTVPLRELGANVVLAPHGSWSGEAPPPGPDSSARHNILVTYASVVPGGPGPEVRGGNWSHVALGGRHSFERFGNAAAYAGSLERVTDDPWSEATEEKGFVTVDLAARAIRFHAVPDRPVVELAPIRIRDRPEEVNARIREVVEGVPGGIDGKIVRMRLEGLGRRGQRSLDPELLTELRFRTAHLDIVLEGPRARVERSGGGREAVGSGGRGGTSNAPEVAASAPVPGTDAAADPSGVR